jgi:hypothetical protein
MDPVTLGALLAALAGGAGGALGAQAWAGVSALVRRPFRYHQDTPAGTAPVSGAAELAVLQDNPADRDRAVVLAGVLLARADAEEEFGQALAGWWAQASQIPAGGEVTSTITGGTFCGPVLQGRDFTNLTFGPAAPPCPPPPGQDPP